MTNSSPAVPLPPTGSPRANQTPAPSPNPNPSLSLLLKQLRLTHMLQHWQDLEQRATQEQWSYSQFLGALCQLEADRRLQNRIKRYLAEAQLPAGKSLASFNFEHCPQLNPAPLMHLAQDTGWIERAENCLLFGPSGTGKTHLAAGLARAAVEREKRVRFYSATTLVQRLQQAKAQLVLPEFLSKLDRFDLLIIDDLGYVKKSEVETSVLFELIAHRYERKSLLVTANQPFSQWDEIFADAMMTVAAIDRLVHHSTIVDIQAESYRKQAAIART